MTMSRSIGGLLRSVQNATCRRPTASNSIALRNYSRSVPLKSSYYRFDGETPANLTTWPVRKTNTVLNIVPQGQCMVVERLGKLHSIEQSGFFWAIPLIDQIAYVIDVRERAMDILPQAAITRDNVSVQVSGNLFVRVQNVELAAYGATNPLYSVTQHAQSAMRSAIGEMELDEILHGRARLNSLIKGTLQEAAVAWGLEVRRYELTEISPDEQIRIAMDKQAAAERDRREHVLRAEGSKRKAELESEGVKIALKNESEGNLIRITNESEANKLVLLRQAEGDAEAIRVKAAAQAQAIRDVAAELAAPGGMEAARLALANEYVNMYAEMGKESNTMIFNERPADVSALLAQVVTAVNATNKMTVGESKTRETEDKATERSVALGNNENPQVVIEQKSE